MTTVTGPSVSAVQCSIVTVLVVLMAGYRLAQIIHCLQQGIQHVCGMHVCSMFFFIWLPGLCVCTQASIINVLHATKGRVVLMVIL
jgi:hypothetical protein